MWSRYILSENGKDLHASPFLRPIDAHLNAFQVCITYLNLDFLNIVAADKESQLQHLFNGYYQLLSYCSSYWIYHLRKCLQLKPDSTTMMEIIAFLSNFLRTRSTTGIMTSMPPGFILTMSVNLVIITVSANHNPRCSHRTDNKGDGLACSAQDGRRNGQGPSTHTFCSSQPYQTAWEQVLYGEPICPRCVDKQRVSLRNTHQTLTNSSQHEALRSPQMA